MSENKTEEEEDKKEKSEKKTKEDEEKEAADKADEEARKKRLVKGDYVVQVHVIEGRELKGRYEQNFKIITYRDFGATSDPMVEVHVMNEKKTQQLLKS
ncbi:hypothetical protein RFI_15035 [Reticulomyxa filosa]|uniref:Uncharacterized protein n=1 Tax=Reticulomyxa filosa TaxID=46433 RepID=X6N8C2_RETFI|nr:hypothetical protein RFI_15035 [Reticulomyxa filosa]|eukprot:ETO22163.1 hypothetical protein RFI_15035 [Reticulomyxa filosa]